MIKVFPERVCGKPIRIGAFIPYDQLRDAIIREGINAGLSLAVEMDEMKAAKGVMSIAVKSEPCIVIYNQNHKKDYYSYVLTETMQGNITFLTQYLGGESRNFRNGLLAENLRGGIVSSIIGGMAKAKQQEEHMYYDVVNEVILNALASLGCSSNY